MTRADLEDSIWETLQDTRDMHVSFRDYARAIVMMLETQGVVRCEVEAEMVELVTDLSDALTDEGPDWSNVGLDNLRRRVANMLPHDRCPEWLAEYRDPPVVNDPANEAV